MKFSHDLTYDAAPDAVLRMLADPAFREQVCDATHAVRRGVSVDRSGDGMTVVVDQTRTTDGAPPIAQKFVGAEIRIVQRESWADATSATLAIEVPGKPARLTGGIRLETRSGATVQEVRGDVEVSIPLLGGKLESLVADTFHAALRTEERVGRAWLAGEG
jgi:hypothetical protein